MLRTITVAAGVLTACGPLERHEPVWVTIPHGASVEVVAESLATYQLVSSPGSFRWFAKFNGATNSLKPGTYRLHAGMSPAAILEELLAGAPLRETLFIPDGSWVNETAWYVERQLGVAADSFNAVVYDSGVVAQVSATGVSLEGYLFPGEYRIRVGATAREVVFVLLEEFERQWQPAWTRRLDTLGMTRDELITLASIVEGEGGVDEDLPFIASVYHNRLENGMRLQADPTVVYALGQRRRLFNADYELDSPYNTYQIEGLPPAPISSPSAAAIEAALYPEETDFLYFVAAENGQHVFSRSYREHLDTIRQLRDK